MIQGETTGSVTHIVESMQVDGADVDNVSRDSNVGVLMPSKVRKNDFVYKLVERSQQWLKKLLFMERVELEKVQL